MRTIQRDNVLLARHEVVIVDTVTPRTLHRIRPYWRGRNRDGVHPTEKFQSSARGGLLRRVWTIGTAFTLVGRNYSADETGQSVNKCIHSFLRSNFIFLHPMFIKSIEE